jgi:aspartate/methionine/tyrosine aminotransferase
VLASPDLTDSIRKVHDFLTVGAAAPLQHAGVVALSMPDSYYDDLASTYAAKRDHILEMLQRTGFRPFRPSGAYYVMADISGFGFPGDREFARHRVQTVGVAVVPGSSFFEHSSGGSQLVRFCFCKKYETLKAAEERLQKI